MIRGAIVGILAVTILLLVPVLGVRHEIATLALNWQELALYVCCLSAGALSGAILVPSEQKTRTVLSISASESIPDQFVDMQLADHFSKVEKRKRAWRAFLSSSRSRKRTRILAVFLYLVLYVNCAVLCQHLTLGIIQAGDLGNTIIRNTGLSLVLMGLYIILRGLFRGRKTSRENNAIPIDDMRENESASLAGDTSHVATIECKEAEKNSEEALADHANHKTHGEEKENVGDAEVYTDGIECEQSESGNSPSSQNQATGAKVEGEETTAVAQVQIHPATKENEIVHSAELSSLPGLSGEPSLHQASEKQGRPLDTFTKKTSDVMPHVPPSRVSFLREHRVCTGWLVVLTGLPLIFLAWFPVIAIPGIFIVMGWMFGKGNNPGDSAGQIS